ncbi:MAG: ATP synthase F0 subunit B [Actinomycetia bacterium]|nr:ATP synthase F0 subunit B [Actinomycetes bacterium]
MEAILGVFREAAREITTDPVTFAIEVVQFGVLVVLIKVVAFGSKKRSGMLVNMVHERRQRVIVSLQEADAGNAALAEAHDKVIAIAAEVEVQAKALLRDARKQARAQAAAIDGDAITRAEAVKNEAREALEREQVEMLEGVRDQLVSVVTQSTQQVLEQGFTPAEQRAVVQKAIISGIDELETVALGRGA